MNFEDAWRRVKLHAAAAPDALCQYWVQQAYNRVLEMRPWAFLRKQAFINTMAARAVSCTVTLNSTAVTAAPGTFLATDVGNQLRIISFPIYTIASVTGPGDGCTLDTVYADTTNVGVVSGTVLTAYFTAPTDFGRFLLVADPYNQRRLPFWITEEELNILDPIRRSTDPSPRMLVSLAFSTVPTLAGQAVFEIWPYATGTTQRFYPYLYFRRPDVLQDATSFVGVFNQRADMFTTGALTEAARWPGTMEQKNGYFNLALSAQLDKQFLNDIQRLGIKDDEVYMQDYSPINWARWPLAGGYDTHLLRSTDADINNYWAMP